MSFTDAWTNNQLEQTPRGARSCQSGVGLGSAGQGQVIAARAMPGRQSYFP